MFFCRDGEQDSWTVKNGDAMVDGIQLGRVFTMFEKDAVRAVLTVVRVVSEGNMVTAEFLPYR